MEFLKPKTSCKTSCFFLNDAMFWRCFWKNIDVDVFDDVLQNAKHRANDASNDVNRPPLDGPAQIRTNWFCPEMGQPKSGQTEFGLKWASPNQDKLILTWNGTARIRTNWFWLEMGQPKSGQTDFGLKCCSQRAERLETSRFFGGFT